MLAYKGEWLQNAETGENVAMLAKDFHSNETITMEHFTDFQEGVKPFKAGDDIYTGAPFQKVEDNKLFWFVEGEWR